MKTMTFRKMVLFASFVGLVIGFVAGVFLALWCHVTLFM